MKAIITFYFFISVLTINAQQSLAGTWNTGQDNTQIEISSTQGVYSGKIIASDNAKAKIGRLLLKDLKSVGEEWKGKLYSPKKNKWLTAVLKEKGDQLLVTVKAGMMSKTLKWKRG